MEKKKKGNIGKKISKLLDCNQCMYSVVQFIDKSSKLFECIPDIWFVDDDNKSACYWPPSRGKSYTLRAMKREIPDDSWEICQCTVVSEGYPTYSLGYSVVREKCSQFYNTSSADEHLEAANFRRKHPGLVCKGATSIEKLFAESKSNKNKEANKENEKSNVQEQKSDHRKPADSGKFVAQQKKSGQGKSVDATENDKGVVQQKSNEQGKSVEAIDSEKIVVPTDEFNNRANSSRSIQRTRTSRRTRSKSKSNNSLSPNVTQSHSSLDSLRPTSSKSHLRSDSHSISHDNAGFKNQGISSNIRRISPQTHSRSRLRSCSRSTCRTNSIVSRRRSSADSPSETCSRKNSSSSESSGSSKASSSSKASKASSSSKASNASRSSRSSTLSQSSIVGQINMCQTSVYSERTTSSTRQRSNSSVRHQTTSGHQRTHFSIPGKSSESSGCSSGSRQRRQLTYSTNLRKSLERSGPQRNRLNEESSSRSISPASIRSHLRSNLSSEPYRRDERQLIPSDKSYRQNVSTNLTSWSSKLELQTLIKEVKELTNIANKNSRRIDENDRRIARMEITLNKTFIMIQDMAHTSNIRMSIGNTNDKLTLPRGFKIPKLPIKHVSELISLCNDLKNETFYRFLVDHEKEFCFPTASTNNVILTAYLKRFISLKVRCKITLKDLKGRIGTTLYRDFNKVYLFIIDVMKAGFQLGNRLLSSDDVKIILRIVWGRSKQLLKEQRKKKKK